MADYCWECAEDRLGIDGEDNDMRALCNIGECTEVLCEGCGPIYVDHNGHRVDTPFCGYFSGGICTFNFLDGEVGEVTSEFCNACKHRNELKTV